MWKCVLELGKERGVLAGSERSLTEAIGRGADLRIYTEFRYNEHIDVQSSNPEMVREVSEFGVTYLLEGRWAAGIMNLRQPISPPESFGPRPSMSFFLYNQNGQQAIARPYLDGKAPTGVLGPSTPTAPENMPNYHASDNWDAETNAPSSNFIYDFECYRFYVRDSWREVLAHDANGDVVSGSIDELADAFSAGSEVKIAIGNLGSGLSGEQQSEASESDAPEMEHEIFVKTGACYYNTEQKLLTAGSHPLVRVRPAIPLRYESCNWDFGWLMTRTDGYVEYRRCDPHSLQFTDQKARCAMRWFVR